MEEYQTLFRDKNQLVRVKEIMHSLLDVALFLLKAQRGCIMLLDEERVNLNVKFAKGYRAEAETNLAFSLGEGIAGWVAMAGRSLVVPSVEKEPLFIKKNSPYADGKQVKTIICVPIRLNHEVVGVVNIDSNGNERCFSAEDLEVLTPIVEQMEKALAREEQEGEQEAFNSVTYLSNLSNIMQELNMGSSKDELNPLFLTSVKELFLQADSGFLLMREEVSENFHLIGCFGEVPEGLMLPCDFYDSNHCIGGVGRQTLMISDRLQALNDCTSCAFKGYKARSMMLAPLLVEGQIIGMLAVGSAFPNSFSQHDMSVLQIISSQMSLLYRTGSKYSELKFYSNNILDSVTIGVVCIDLSGKVNMVSKGAGRILEVEQEELLGKYYQSYGNHFELNKIEEGIRKLMATGEPVENLQLTFYTFSKRKKNLNVGLNLLRNSKEATIGITIVFDDITERQSLEEQLRRTERLLVAGQLAAGAAHEIRNPLTTIKGFSQILKSTFQEGDPRIEYVETMLQETEQINNIIGKMDGLAKSELGEVDWIDVPVLIDEVLHDERKEGSLNHITVNAVFDSGIPPVLGNTFKLKQVFFQLVKNSIQSMEDGGKLNIGVYSENLEQVTIELSDTGAGIAQEERELIFNPFFTNKPDGMGLGLALSYKTIREHGGTMEVESSLGKGTKILIKMPINFQFVDILDIEK
ncbi:MAG: GAF domain-containing protein [Bacillota bacterium]|nr:GAF domain-containing protein [Bacillota bacterium]